MMKNFTLLATLLLSSVCFAQLNLPVDFESTTLDYGLTDFGGTASSIVIDPTDGTNMVAQTIRTAGSETYAGTTVGATVGFDTPIPFDADNTIMSVRVWSPAAGLPIRLKVENSGDPTASVETQTVSTVAMDWEVVIFDFVNQATGTASINFGSSYNKATIFFNFDQPQGTSVEQTFYWDDMTFVGGTSGSQGVVLPVTFDDPSITYGFSDFGGAASQVVVDPTDATNMAAQTIRTAGAETFAGTVVGGGALASPVPFSEGNTLMSVRVWSPEAGIPVRFKVETTGGGPFVEVEVNTTLAQTFETLVFDFSTPVATSPTLNLANGYNQLVIFFNFDQPQGTSVEQIFYWDDVAFGDGSVAAAVDLPITFELNIDYVLQDFAGAATEIVVDPTDGANNVARTIRSNTAETFAGTVVGNMGFANDIPFSPGNTLMNVRVWSPEAGLPVRLKVESTTNASPGVESEMMTTVAMEWETITFDFLNNATGNTLDVNGSYDRVVIFFNFEAMGSVVGEQTFYWDDLYFGAPLGLQDINGQSNIEVFPNPATDFVNVNFLDGKIDNVKLALFDLSGKIVGRYNVNATNMRIDVSSLSVGQYILRIDTPEAGYFQKIAVTK